MAKSSLFRIPSYLRHKIGYISRIHIRKRVPFTYEDVAAGWGTRGAGLPKFSARLYREVRLLDEAIGSYHARKSVEIGCGYGRLTPWIAEHSEAHYAVEPESVLLNDARKLYPQIHFYHSKAQKLPFRGECFDLCVSWTVLQHIPPKEMTKAVAEIKRVCTRGAIMILAEAVGGQEMGGTWEHSLDEWKDLLLPWKLTWFTQRKIEETYKDNAGLVMRFERV